MPDCGSLKLLGLPLLCRPCPAGNKQTACQQCKTASEGESDLLRLQVRIVASLPCYSEQNVDQQRGSGVFQRSIQGLQMLNEAGYGQPGTGLHLDLVYNPNGIFLAPQQNTLEVG